MAWHARDRCGGGQLTTMVLRDYLELKVEIEGTSGEGSLAVKSLRLLVRRGPLGLGLCVACPAMYSPLCIPPS